MKLSAEHLAVRLSGREILHDVSVEFPEERVTLILGGNGSGKSTLLRALAGILPASGGEVRFDGVPLSGMSRREAARRCAILLQDPYAPPEISVAELAALGRFPHGGRRARTREAVRQALAETGLTALADRRIDTLSGGERRKAFLARALAQETELMLLDEPEAALDAAARHELLITLRKLRRTRRLTVVMAVHDLDFALGAADLICGLKAGTLRFAAPPEQAATPENLRELYGIGSTVFSDRHGRMRAIPDYSDCNS